MYPEYKAKRKAKKLLMTDEEKTYDNACHIQSEEIRTYILPDVGFVNNFMRIGYEGDDLIASIIVNNPEHEFIIVSSDADLYQLLSPTVSIYDLNKKQRYTENDLFQEHRTQSILWGEVKAIAGCTSDEVKGVSGVGIKTAIKYLNHELSFTSATYKKIASAEGDAIIKRNRELVKLPLKGTENIRLKKGKKIKLCSLQKYFTEYGLLSMVDDLPKWKKLLNI
jgi:5'-3' exonuclease